VCTFNFHAAKSYTLLSRLPQSTDLKNPVGKWIPVQTVNLYRRFFSHLKQIINKTISAKDFTESQLAQIWLKCIQVLYTTISKHTHSDPQA
jgi:hypothetical protein